MSIAKNIRALREAKGFTQRELGSIMRVDSTYISSLECGRVNPGLEMIQNLSDALDCTPNDLFGIAREKAAV